MEGSEGAEEGSMEWAKAQFKRKAWKTRILEIMYDPVSVSFAEEKEILPKDTTGRLIRNPTVDEYKKAIINYASLEDLIAFCSKKRIVIKEVTDEIDKSRNDKEFWMP
jgi:hypothetical protein